MRVKCIKNNAKLFSEKHFHLGFTPQSEFNLEIDKEYIVYGINLWRGIFSFLIIGERSERPSWYPVEAFEIVHNLIPPSWCFRIFDDHPDTWVQMIMGYDELVNAFETNYSALIDYEVEALRIFYKRKTEIDAFV